jgi:hypothetical protein
MQRVHAARAEAQPAIIAPLGVTVLYRQECFPAVLPPSPDHRPIKTGFMGTKTQKIGFNLNARSRLDGAGKVLKI